MAVWFFCCQVAKECLNNIFNHSIVCLFNEGHLEKLLADKKLDEGKRKEYESVIGQVITWAYLLSSKGPDRGNLKLEVIP